jgi:TolB protein
MPRWVLEATSESEVCFATYYDVSDQVPEPFRSPDGKSFAFIQRTQGRYSLALTDFATRQTQILTDSPLDGSPTFAPNGRLIMYASIVGGRGILAAVSSDGRIKQKITASAQDVREPAWGPLVGNR